MSGFPSRSEAREVKLYAAAENGLYCLERQVLYSREIQHLRSCGFKVTVEGNFDVFKKLYYATIDWSRPYSDGIPHIVWSYIHHIIETYPKKAIHNFAQELFVIAQRS